jgi:hypothetical protein
VELAQRTIGVETSAQYANEERALLRKRFRLAQDDLGALFAVMRTEELAPADHVARLAGELAEQHGLPVVRTCHTMGALLELHLRHRLELDLPVP